METNKNSQQKNRNPVRILIERLVMFFCWEKEYKIVSCEYRADLSREVNSLLSQGWDVLGGVGHMAMKTGGNQHDFTFESVWYQSMYREVKRK